MQVTHTTQITQLSHDGRGIARLDGKTIFVANALPGETVTFEIHKKHRHYDEAKVIEILSPSEARTQAPCAHFGICGGCSLQHISPLAQITLKQKTLLEQLSHIGGVVPETVLPPLQSESSIGYRRRARLGVRYVHKKGRLLIGFREQQGRYLADIEQCLVLHPSIGLQLPVLRECISQLEAYQDIPQIEVAVGDNATALVIRHLKSLSESDLQKLSIFASEKNFMIFLQPGDANSIHPLTATQSTELNYALTEDSLQFQFRPTDFVQINASINAKMVAQALTLLTLSPEDRVLDLFCGLGNFSLPMARHCASVVGVEGEAGLVSRAQQNAALNHIENVCFYAANLMQDCANEPWIKQTYDKILIDPPRTGALEIIPLIATFRPKRIVYVSCNPATLSRDAGELAKHGYTLKQVGVMDMFPHTQHVEAMAVFDAQK